MVSAGVVVLRLQPLKIDTCLRTVGIKSKSEDWITVKYAADYIIAPKSLEKVIRAGNGYRNTPKLYVHNSILPDII